MLSESRRSPCRKLCGAAALTLLFLIIWSPCAARYFGRNKVKYETFDFRTIETNNFKLYYYPPESAATRDAARMLERWYGRFSALFKHQIKQKQPVILYANHADFQQTNVIGGLISQGTGGVTEGMKRRMVIPFTGIYSEDNHVLGHELVHAFQFDMAAAIGSGPGAAARIPTWFIEGMPEYMTLGQKSPLTAMWMRDAVIRDEVPTIREVSRNPEYFPYRYGHAIWSYLTRRWGDSVIRELFRVSVRKGWRRAAREVLDLHPDSLSRDWQRDLRKRYRPALKGRDRPGKVGRRIISGGSGMNLSPSASPDGSYLVFFSRRDVFTLDLFLADAESGEVIRKLVSSSSDAHFDALRFTGTSGAWSPDGSRFCMVVFKNGNNELAIIEIPSGEVIRQFPLKGIRAIHNVSWSPEGDRLAVSANSGSSSDLFIHHLESRRTERVTNDRFAELQPCWSPDGNTIAFITDRGPGTDMERLDFGTVVVGVMKMDTGRIELISVPGAGRHVSPQFTPDGDKILLVADPEGFSDIFSYHLASGRIRRLTSIATGVSGLTELSPALSVSAGTGDLFFNVFDEMEYRIHSLAPSCSTRSAQPAESRRVETSRPFLTPEGPGRIVDRYLDNPARALPSPGQYSVSEYDPDLRLVYAGMSAAGVTADRSGTSISGGTTLLLSDMLGNYNLGITAYASGSTEDIGGEIAYRDLRDRYNWGALAGHLSYRTMRSYTSLDTVEVDGEKILGHQYNLLTTRTFVDHGYLSLDYPFSTNRRLEFNAGYTRYSYDAEVESYLTVDGYTVDHSMEEISAPSPLNLFRAAAAYVGDYSFFGFTSPARGRRYRLEVEQNFGSLRFLTVTLDYRHYLFIKPVTLAARIMHVGRYLKDAESEHLPFLYLGNRTLVRGYSMGSFDLKDCESGDGRTGCPRIDRLSGSRIGILNFELRLPLLGTDDFGVYTFPYLPTEISLFLDGGVAWTGDQTPELKIATDSYDRVPVFSAGGAIRINLSNYLVAQFFAAYPFQRPGKGWQWGFLLAPGW